MFGKVLNSFVGKISQVPPMYSAIKVNGKKLYEYARKGLNIEVEPRKIEIYNIELQNINDNKIDFKVHCSKGTYIRSLCEDIAKKLDTVGYMEELKRLKVGKFEIKDSIEIEELERNKENKEILKKYFITLEEYFINNESISLDDRKLNMFLNGVKLTYKMPNGIYKIYNNNKFIGIGNIDNELLKRDIILK
ncbi:MAG: hypothetical protein U0O04_06195 [Clostridia bacterium]|jgi:tRNA pseudouridine55 synthase|nr:tRNA pseudouridine synthase B [Clostridium sp. CAG:571]HJJ06954.1 hypothetical protein [Clostridiaceae bacterium]